MIGEHLGYVPAMALDIAITVAGACVVVAIINWWRERR